MSNQNEVLNKMEENLNAQIAKISADKRKVLLGSAFIALVLVTYFSFMTRLIRAEVKADDIAKILTVNVTEFVSSETKEYCNTIIKLASQNTKEFMDSTFLTLFDLRRDMQNAVVIWVEEKFDRTEDLLDGLMDFAYREHSQDVKLLIKNLDTPQGCKIFEDYLTELIAGPISTGTIQIEIESLQGTLEGIQAKMSRLIKAGDLAPVERVERDLLFSVREYWGRFERAVPK